MTADLAIRPPAPAETMDTQMQAARVLASSALIPRPLRGHPQDVLVILLVARELGIGPMHALNAIHVVEGKPVMSAELMRALILRAGHEVRVDGQSAQAASISGRRQGEETWQTFGFTREEAEAAGLLGKDNWRKYPADMLLARATSRMARAVFPDVIAGVSYIPDEIEPAAALPTTTETPPSTTRGAVEIAEQVSTTSDPEGLRGLWHEAGQAGLLDTEVEGRTLRDRITLRLQDAAETAALTAARDAEPDAHDEAVAVVESALGGEVVSDETDPEPDRCTQRRRVDNARCTVSALQADHRHNYGPVSAS